jgi:DMSO reductase family type II enzyme chaperone
MTERSDEDGGSRIEKRGEKLPSSMFDPRSLNIPSSQENQMDASAAAISETNDAIDQALARATLYSALALGFRAPAQNNIVRLVSPPDSKWLAEAATILDPGAMYQLRSAAEALSNAGRVDITVLASLHVALFGHTARGSVPPYETEYGNEALFQQPQELSDLMGFYHAFGLALKEGQHERPDHISCECEFLSFLALKEAYAIEHNDPDMWAETCKAQKLFLRDHLGRFVPTFAQTVGQHDRGGFYGKLADLSLDLVRLESLRLDVPLGAMNLSLRPADDDRVPMACGSGTECTAMPGACSTEEAD